MPKSAAERAGIPLGPIAASFVPHPEDPAWRDWQARFCRPTASLLEAGDAVRIGSGAGTTRKQLANHIRNEMILRDGGICEWL